MQRAVLVVDEGVDVSDVGLVDQLGGWLVVGWGPSAEFDVRWAVRRRRRVSLRAISGLRRAREVVLHVESRMHDEAGLEEGLFDGAGAVEEKLRLDAVDVGRVQEEIEEGAKEGVGDVQGCGWVVGYCVGVSDDGLVSFVDAEGETADASAIERDEAGQDAGVEVLQQQLGRALVVPAQLLLPDAQPRFQAADGAGVRRSA